MAEMIMIVNYVAISAIGIAFTP